MTAPAELYINEECRDAFQKELNEAFGEGRWKLYSTYYNNYMLSQLPEKLYVPVWSDYDDNKCLGMAIITNNFDIDEDVEGTRYVVIGPEKIEIFKVDEDDKVCMQCQPHFHYQTLHSPKGCIMPGCGCRVVNVTRKQL